MRERHRACLEEDRKEKDSARGSTTGCTEEEREREGGGTVGCKKGERWIQRGERGTVECTREEKEIGGRRQRERERKRER